MKKNNFFIVALLGVVVLSGINFEARGMQTTVALIGAVGTVSAVWYLNNTELGKTYEQHKTRLAEEQEKSANPLLYAQPLKSSGLAQAVTPVEERIAAYEAQQKKGFEDYQLRKIEVEKPRTIKNEFLWNEKQLIESYGPEKQ